MTAGANADDRPSAAEANARADRALAVHRSDVHASDSNEFRRYSTVVDPSGAVHVRCSSVHEAVDGAWMLRVRDAYRYDTGYLDTWTLTV